MTCDVVVFVVVAHGSKVSALSKSFTTKKTREREKKYEDPILMETKKKGIFGSSFEFMRV